MVGKITPATYLSTSRAPVLMEVSKYMTRNGLMAEILEARSKGLTSLPGTPLNEKMKYGNRREEEIITDTSEALNCVAKTDIKEPYGWYGPGKPMDFINTSIDGLLKPLDGGYIYPTEHPDNAGPKVRFPQGQDRIRKDGVGVNEAKTHFSFEIYDDLPGWLGRYQLLAQMKCYGAKWGAVSVLFNGNELVIYVFEQDEAVISELEERAKDFYKRLEGPDYYPVSDLKDALATYSTAESDLPPVDLGGNNRELAEELYLSKKLEHTNKALIAGLEAEMVEKLGLHEVGVLYDEIGQEIFRVERKNRKYKASPEKTVPAKPARVERQKSITFKSDWKF